MDGAGRWWTETETETGYPPHELLLPLIAEVGFTVWATQISGLPQALKDLSDRSGRTVSARASYLPSVPRIDPANGYRENATAAAHRPYVGRRIANYVFASCMTGCPENARRAGLQPVVRSLPVTVIDHGSYSVRAHGAHDTVGTRLS